mgnify:CR=1 FL=1
MLSGRTDVGISFLVEAEGKKIFHAGDLNNWHWMDESSEAEWKGYERDYLFELDCICSYTRNMDVVMFPVDPRLGTEYMRGARQFVEQIKNVYLCTDAFFGIVRRRWLLSDLTRNRVVAGMR